MCAVLALQGTLNLSLAHAGGRWTLNNKMENGKRDVTKDGTIREQNEIYSFSIPLHQSSKICLWKVLPLQAQEKKVSLPIFLIWKVLSKAAFNSSNFVSEEVPTNIVS